MNIVVVGGGTAGWLAGLIVSKVKPEHTVTVIESSNIGIVGAGEGSTGALTNVIQNITFNYGCNEQDFINSCDVTPKLGIEFKHWTPEKTSFISPIDSCPTSNSAFDYMFLHAVAEMDPKQRHTITECGYLIEHNKDTFALKDGPHAYHFDAHKVGKYFKKVCGSKVTHIDSEVTRVNHNDAGYIKSLTLSNGTELNGDFFIDATGFARVLMTSLGNTWKTYNQHLPVNRAMPFFMKYEKDEVIKPVTTAWAQNNGWMWDIPVVGRRGCGYVYSSEYVSDDQAHAELEQTIGKKVEPIRVLKFDAGRLDKPWLKNCLAIGLASAFAEPLEATSIHTTINQLEDFVFHCLKPTLEETCAVDNVNTYNDKTEFMYDLLRDFLVIHYQGGRQDTDFWKHVNSGATLTDFSQAMIEMSKVRAPNNFMYPGVPGIAGWALWCHILAGTNQLSPAVAKRELDMYRFNFPAKFATDRTIAELAMKCHPLPDNTKSIRKRQYARTV